MNVLRILFHLTTILNVFAHPILMSRESVQGNSPAASDFQKESYLIQAEKHGPSVSRQKSTKIEAPPSV